jgi:hypothetical protein
MAENTGIEPIVLTVFGETMENYPESTLRDDANLGKPFNSNCVGIHSVCKGIIDWIPVSTTHNALHCRVCGLRILVPNGIVTYGGLRQWVTNQRRIGELVKTRLLGKDVPFGTGVF